MTHFILASQSPRRRQLLALLNYPFEVTVAGVDEDLVTTPVPAENARLTAKLKAEAIVARLDAAEAAEKIIIAADTTVALDETMLNKPADAAEANAMLVALRGRTHTVHTGVALVHLADGRELSGVHSALVTMRPYTAAEIERYIASGDPYDKAGAYAIQHAQFQPVAALNGCFLGVMGLSICHLLLLLAELGVPARVDWAALEAAHQGYACPVYTAAAQKLGK